MKGSRKKRCDLAEGFVSQIRQRQGTVTGELADPIGVRLPVPVRDAIYAQPEPSAWVRKVLTDAAIAQGLVANPSTNAPIVTPKVNGTDR
jgi:hypothetical protein